LSKDVVLAEIDCVRALEDRFRDRRGARAFPLVA
jgi:hypothetical protein